MRNFLAELNNAGKLLIIKKTIDPREISATINHTKAPILIENIKGYEKYSIASGFFTTREMIAKIMNCPEREIAQGFDNAIKCIAPPTQIIKSPGKRIVKKGAEVDLTEIPIPLVNVYDGGPYITGGIVISKDPLGELGTNLGMYRLMYRTKNSTGIDLATASDLRIFYQRALKLKKPLPVSIVIGVHPALMVASTYKAPLGLSEYEVAGGILGSPVDVVIGDTNDIMVPAGAEIVLEGEILPIGWVEKEGPFGDVADFRGEIKWNPIVKINCMSIIKEKPIYYALGMPQENIWLQAASTEMQVLRALINTGIKVHEVRSTVGGACIWHVLVSIEKNAGEGKNALLAALSVVGVKYAIVTDSDVNIYDQDEIDRAMIFRVQPENDVIILKGLKALHNDPSVEPWKIPKGELPTTSKLGIDATIPDGIPPYRYETTQTYGMDSLDLNNYLYTEKGSKSNE